MSRGKWIICPTCSGDGAHSRALGAITEEDRERDWSHDEWEDYMNGGYDTTCDTCSGSGKLRDDEEGWAKHEAQLRSERFDGRFNEAGEPLW